MVLLEGDPLTTFVPLNQYFLSGVVPGVAAGTLCNGALMMNGVCRSVLIAAEAFDGSLPAGILMLF